MSILPVIVSFAGGSLIAYLNYRVTKKLMAGDGNKALGFVMGRQLINIAYLAAVFFICRKVLEDIFPPLIAAAVGLTVPAFIFSLVLSKQLRSEPSGSAQDDQQKGDDDT